MRTEAREAKRGQRTLLIGLDGGTFTILDPLMARGEMPNTAFLVRQGVRAELASRPIR